MKMLTFAKRNTKEILRDPLTLFFGIGFPVVLLLLLSLIQSNIPVPLFELVSLTPGVTVFGLSFVTLFSALIVARDRTTSFLVRLYTTPMTAADFIGGYALPLIPLSLAQGTVCYLVAFCLGLAPSVYVLCAILFLLPVSFFYIALGLLFGSILNDKQVGGICGALLTNLSAWLSGIWFDLELIGGFFAQIANFLPFVHAVELERAVLIGDFSAVLVHLPWVFGYGIAAFLAAAFLFMKQMKK